MLERTSLNPGIVLVTGGSGVGKTTFYRHMKTHLGLTENTHFNDAVFLEEEARKEHEVGLGRSHIHPEEVEQELAVQYVRDEVGNILGHTHGTHTSPTHFPFEISNSLLTEEEYKNGNPLVRNTYERFFKELLTAEIDPSAYMYTELAGGVNMLPDVCPDHHMANLDVSYQRLWEIFKETCVQMGKELHEVRHKISCIIDISTSSEDRLQNTQTRMQPEEARTNALLYVQGKSDAKEAFADTLGVPYITVVNTHTPSESEQQRSFYEQVYVQGL